MTQQELEAVAGILNSPWFMPLVIWSAAWKGIALWKSARNASKFWFIALLVINTVGILEIIYIFFFSKKREKSI